jgi:hypothetical protein
LASISSSQKNLVKGKCIVSFKKKKTFAMETWSEGKDSGTVGNVNLIQADMMYQEQQCKNGFKLPIVNYQLTLMSSSSHKVHIPCKKRNKDAISNLQH